MRHLMLFVLLAACKGGEVPGETDPPVAAIWDPARPTHYFDLPFPSDDLRGADGTVDLSGFPTVEDAPLGRVATAWLLHAGTATRGFGVNQAAYFRFAGPLSLPPQTQGQANDPVVLIDLDTAELFPLDLRFVQDPADDPWYGPNTLSMAPQMGHAPPSGAHLAAVVLTSAGASAPSGFRTPDGVRAALDAAGIDSAVAVATTYQTQDSIAQLEAIEADMLDWLAQADLSEVVFQRVSALEYSQGTTASGEEATLATTTFADGSTETIFQAKCDPGACEHTVDLGEDWPMAVYQAQVPLPYYQGLEDRPFMRPGLGMLADTERTDGQIGFDAEGRLADTPEVDTARVILSLPKDSSGEPIHDAPVFVWDHGTGGTAMNHVQRKKADDLGIELNTRFAAAGTAVLGHDQPLYGSRFPLIDEGFTDGSLGFYNIVNLPAFRDNQRQGGLESNLLGHMLADGHLDHALPAPVDGSDLRRGGHSLGSVTAHNGMAANPDMWQAGLTNGSGGYLVVFFLESGLAGTGHGLFETLESLLGIEVGPDDDLGVVLAAALGVKDADAAANFDRLHPVVGLFQWVMDPSDPAALAHRETLDQHMVIGIGDLQVPNTTSEALLELLPQAQSSTCEVATDYDPHLCFFREPAGFDALADWLE